VRIKKIAAAIAAAGILMTGNIFAANATDSDIAQLQQQVKQLQNQINQLGKNDTVASNSTTADSKKASSKTSKSASFIQTEPAWSQTMTNNQHLTNRDLDVLKARASGEIAANTIYIGGKGEIDAAFTRASGGSNTSPNAGNELNKSQIIMPFVDIIFTAAIGEWITGFADIQVGDQLGTPIGGQNSGSNAQNSNVTLPQAYFVIGNSAETPLFATLGVKVIDFGDFRQENNLLPTLTQFGFMAQGGQLAAGYYKEGLSTILTVMNGGGTALTNSATANPNAINNFAINIAYDVQEFHAGIGYINATGFNGDGGQGANPFDPTQPGWNGSVNEANGRVGAVTINAGVDMEVFTINADYAITTKTVNGLNASSAFNSTGANINGYAPLNATLGNSITQNAFNAGKVVNSWDINGAFNFKVTEEHDLKIFGSYSQMYQDTNNSIYQFVVGARVNIIDTVWFGPSYQYFGGKLSSTPTGSGDSIQSTNTLLLDITAFF